MQTFIPPPQATKKILIENATAKQVLFYSNPSLLIATFIKFLFLSHFDIHNPELSQQQLSSYTPVLTHVY